MLSGLCWIKFACHASRVQQVQTSVRTLLAQDRFLGTVTNFSKPELKGALVIFWVSFVWVNPDRSGPLFLRELDQCFGQRSVVFIDWDFPKIRYEES